jgi:hypothetical protein
LVTTGKGKHKEVIGFQLNFNAPLNAAAAQDPSNYTVVQQTKHGHKTVSRPVAFRAVYDASSDSVQLLLKGRAKFAKGGQIVVNPTSPGAMADTSGGSLTSEDGNTPMATTTFTVLPGARGVTG